MKVAEPWRVDPIYGGPEYEALAVFGSNCGVEDLKAVCKANEICNRYSLDVLSTGDTIAFAMECYENGILTDTDTGGLKLEFCVINLPAIPRSYGRRFETNLKGLFLCESVIFTFCSVDHDC